MDCDDGQRCEFWWNREQTDGTTMEETSNNDHKHLCVPGEKLTLCSWEDGCPDDEECAWGWKELESSSDGTTETCEKEKGREVSECKLTEELYECWSDFECSEAEGEVCHWGRIDGVFWGSECAVKPYEDECEVDDECGEPQDQVNWVCRG